MTPHPGRKSHDGALSTLVDGPTNQQQQFTLIYSLATPNLPEVGDDFVQFLR